VSISLYFFGGESLSDFQTKLLPLESLFMLGLSAPLILILGALTILNQSCGRDDLYLVSILRIAFPLICIFFFGKNISAWSFTVSYICIAVLALLLGVAIHRRSHFRIFHEN
jgi:hypothetical protein